MNKTKNILIGVLTLNFLILLSVSYGILDSANERCGKYSDFRKEQLETQKISRDLEFRIKEDIVRYKTFLISPNDYNKTQYIELLKDSLKRNIKVLRDNNLTQLSEYK